MNAILLLLIATMLVLFNLQASETDPGTPSDTQEPDETEEPDDDVDDDDNGDNGDNGDIGDIFTFNIEDQLTLDLIYANHETGIASFPQEFVTLDMTEEDVVAAYGEPENLQSIFGYTVHQYGDIGVAYFEEESTVADVLYIPTITYDELIAVLGQPDQESIAFEEGVENDMPYANYLIQEKDEGNLYASFKLLEDDNGVLNVWFMEKLLLDTQVTDITEEEMDEVATTLNGYFQSLGAYYRGESDDIFNYIYDEDNALHELIVSNNESGDFVNYEVLSWNILDIISVDDTDGVFEVWVEREYTFGDDSQFEEVSMIIDQTEDGMIVESVN